ncbi:MAG: DUF4876 domain-containing protein [Bacteroidales bacterium]|nr:DUF4876 domain-containing protein [Bacteroidales bacterium]
MKRLLYILFISVLLMSCDRDKAVPYGDLCEVSVMAEYPSEFSSFVRQGVTVRVEDINLGSVYESGTDGSGCAHFKLVKGLYRFSISDIADQDIFNGTSDKVSITSSSQVRVGLMHSKAGSIIIKEIYCGGCKRLPQEGTYQMDKYIVLHNNDFRVQYLDSLCFGSLSPYNSNSNNVWVSRDPVTDAIIYPDFVPIVQCIWQFGGSGHDFPLQPGEDAVLAVHGAIDHTIQYPLSVNLNKPDYFVCYNSTYFTNPSYHPAPGNLISQDRILDVVIKTGQANAYTLSLNSPAVVIFRAQGTAIEDFVLTPDAVKPTPGDTHNPIVAIPPEWVVDAVEVFNGSTNANTKRLQPSLDAGYVTLSETYLGHSLMRKVDAEASQKQGYEVLSDTNNSSVDFYESEKQSLHE